MSSAVTSLNNYLQDKQQLHLLAWAEQSSGELHSPKWTVECKINGELKGTGIANSKADAKQIAARQALDILKGKA